MPRQIGIAVFALSVLAIASNEKIHADDFPLLPDFKRRVDYIRYFAGMQGSASSSRNAYPDYAAFMPGLVESNVQPGAWPKFRGMLTTPMHERANQTVGRDGKPTWPPGPGPWIGLYEPQWQVSYQVTKPVLAKYRAATEKSKLVPPIPLDGSAEDRNNRLVHLYFPHLMPLDDCAKGVLEAAWRIGDEGEVEARALGEAVEANLRLAGQMKNCLSVPEFSAQCAIRKLTYEHIFWGFAHGVFFERNANTLFKLLQDIDGKEIDAELTAAGECAIWLDAIQYIYGPFDNGAKFNGNRYRDITGQSMGGGGGLGMGIGARVDASPAEEIARKILDTHRSMQRQMNVGYAESNHGSLIALADQLRNAHGVTKGMFMTGHHVLASAYTLAAEAEAHRRAAQIVAAIHAYKKAREDWPKQLADLGKRVSSKVLRDPYGSDEFVYQVTDNGPVLYSVGTNGKDDGGTPDKATGDLVFWPIPESAGWIAHGQLVQVKNADLTKLSDVNSSIDGKTVVVEGKITAEENQISPQHGRILRLTLGAESGKADVFYYKTIADQLRPDQDPKRGATIRVRGTVVKEGDGFKVQLMDARELAVLTK